jgi:hypothetical protein
MIFNKKNNKLIKNIWAAIAVLMILALSFVSLLSAFI